jgi:hypothetical protein
MVISSLLDKLLSELSKTENLINDLLDSSTIRNNTKKPEVIGDYRIIIPNSPRRCWGILNDDGIIKQANSLKAFNSSFEIIEFISSDKPNNIKSR